jgi:cytochrome d ubiquinol oxidase subunit I
MSAGDPLFWHRLQFAFTIVYHYLFPQLTMGLALLIVVMKAIGLRTRNPAWDDAARFWIRIFGINFAVGVVTGIPMEFQFGTNWARFAEVAGSVVGQTLAMEGVFAFFLESSFLGLLIFGEKRLGSRGHFLAALALFVGSWLSGYFIIASNAFMQSPTGHSLNVDGTLRLADFSEFVLNPWAIAAYLHTMTAAVVTASFVVAAVGAYYTLTGVHLDAARRFLRVGTTAGLISAILVAFPTGDRHAKLVARHQPAALAAMEGRFTSGPMAGITLIGQPNVAERRMDNPIEVPGHPELPRLRDVPLGRRGSRRVPRERLAGQHRALYYAFHVMAGLGTIFIAIMALSVLLAWRGTVDAHARDALGAHAGVSLPVHRDDRGVDDRGAGTAAVGRVRDPADEGRGEPDRHAGTALFTLIGFAGPLLRARPPLPVPRDARDRARTEGAPWLSSGTRSSR